MLGIYFSGTGNTKYCVQRFLKLMDTSIESYSIEDPLAVQEIKKTSSNYIWVSYSIQ